VAFVTRAANMEYMQICSRQISREEMVRSDQTVDVTNNVNVQNSGVHRNFFSEEVFARNFFLGGGGGEEQP
jgi:hypothetical protein